MKTRTLLFAALLTVSPAVSYGQLGNLLKRNTSKVLNTAGEEASKDAIKQVDKVVEKKLEKMVDNAISSSNGNSKDNQKQGMGLGKMFSNKVDIKYNEDYNFSSRVYIETESFDKKETSKADLYLYFNSESPTLGIETMSNNSGKDNSGPETSTILMDGENKCFLLLLDENGTKMGVITAINEDNPVHPNQPQPQPQLQTEDKTVQNAPPLDYKPVSFIKTGSTRIIAGYRCDEYSYTDPDNKTKGNVWFTKDMDLKIDKRGWQKTALAPYYGYSTFEGGIILAAESYDADGKPTGKIETKEISQNSHYDISVKGYALRQMQINPNLSQK
ncbi:MAG: hypothetical protein WA816_05170 [Bacteroidales bacterium]